MSSELDELADEIAGQPIGSGYYGTTVGIDDARDIADVLLAAGYRKPRTITTVEELNALPNGSAILDSEPDVVTKIDGVWQSPNYEGERFGAYELGLPVTVLHEPEADQ